MTADRRRTSCIRLILGCILAAFLGGTFAIAQSPITATKPLTTPGLNQPLLVPPATTPKSSPGATGSGLGLGAQSVPGISPVTNPQASKGGSDAEKIDQQTLVTVRGFDKVDRLTRGGKSSEQAKGKSTEQKVWLPSNFGRLPGADRPAKVDAVTTKQSTKPDEIGVARELAKPPSKNKKGGGDSAEDKSKFGTWGPGYTPDKSSTDKSRLRHLGAGIHTRQVFDRQVEVRHASGPGYTPDKSSKDGSTSGQSQTGKEDDKNQSSQ